MFTKNWACGLLSLYLCITVTSCIAGKQSFAVNVNTDGSYNVVVQGDVWLKSAPIFFRSEGEVFTTADGSLKLVKNTQSSGVDFIGQWQSNSFLYQAGTSQIEASFVQYTPDTSIFTYNNPAIPFMLFKQLFIRGLHDRGEVLAARMTVLQYLKDQGEGILHPAEPLEKGVLQQGCGVGCVPTMEGIPSITHRHAVKAVIEGHRPFSFFKKFFGKDVTTLDFKWLRAVHTDAFTGVHVDNVYMSRGSKSLLTMWTTVGDISVEMGVVAMCEGSNRLPGFDQFQNTYGNLDAEEARLKGTGWFTTDPFEITDKFGGQWKTTDFKAGGVMIFGMRTAHMSTCNLTNLARISFDTRWQPSDEPTSWRARKVPG